MARYCVTVELWDMVDVEVEAPDDSDRETILDAVEDKFMEEGYPKYYLHMSRKNAQIVQKGVDEERWGWVCD